MPSKVDTISDDRFERRRELFNKVIDAFGQKYSWLGAQAAREMLLSAASWNIQKYSDPPMRYRNHLMLAWERGWVKSTMMRKMATILGDEMCSTIGKVTDAAMRGSVSAGKFMPPKPMKTPIVISTEFGQTSFDDELLNLFLNMLEEGYTNVALNKLGSLPDSQKKEIEDRFDGSVQFGEQNEFTIKCDFVFWGATYDAKYLQDDAMRSRFNVVTPAQELTAEVTKSVDKAPSVLSQLQKEEVRQIRRELQLDKPVKTDYIPTDGMYKEFDLIPRESRDVQAYMAARHWWGLNVNPEVMQKYIAHLKESRKVAMMNPEERVFELIFDNPMTYEELQSETRYNKRRLYKILQRLNARQVPQADGTTAWAVHSGDSVEYLDDDDNGDDSSSSGLSSLSDKLK